MDASISVLFSSEDEGSYIEPRTRRQKRKQRKIDLKMQRKKGKIMKKIRSKVRIQKK